MGYKGISNLLHLKILLAERPIFHLFVFCTFISPCLSLLLRVEMFSVLRWIHLLIHGPHFWNPSDGCQIHQWEYSGVNCFKVRECVSYPSYLLSLGVFSDICFQEISPLVSTLVLAFVFTLSVLILKWPHLYSDFTTRRGSTFWVGNRRLSTGAISKMESQKHPASEPPLNVHHIQYLSLHCSCIILPVTRWKKVTGITMPIGPEGHPFSLK